MTPTTLSARSGAAVRTVLALAALCAAGCTYYEQPAPYYAAPAGPSSFDRSWSAATGALEDQGVRIISADRSVGVIRGTRDGIDVTANVGQQADGRVRVEFNTSGATKRDPGLIDRVHGSYERRMGR